MCVAVFGELELAGGAGDGDVRGASRGAGGVLLGEDILPVDVPHLRLGRLLARRGALRPRDELINVVALRAGQPDAQQVRLPIAVDGCGRSAGGYDWPSLHLFGGPLGAVHQHDGVWPLRLVTAQRGGERLAERGLAQLVVILNLNFVRSSE